VLRCQLPRDNEFLVEDEEDSWDFHMNSLENIKKLCNICGLLGSKKKNVLNVRKYIIVLKVIKKKIGSLDINWSA